MRHSRKTCVAKGCKRCLIAAAVLNNTPLGFLSEHMLWEKVPYISLIPQALGLH